MSKSKLQEFLQKNKSPLPKYSTYCTGGSSHQPEWECKLEINDIIVVSDKFASKKTAEQDAASKALEIIFNNLPTIEKTTVNFKGKSVHIIIDVENKPNFIDELFYHIEIPRNYEITGVISENHHSNVRFDESAKKYEELAIIDKVVIPSTRKNGADVGLCVFVGICIANNIITKNSLVVVVSSDNFAYALCDCLNNSHRFMGKDCGPIKAVTCTSIEKFLKLHDEV